MIIQTLLRRITRERRTMKIDNILAFLCVLMLFNFVVHGHCGCAVCHPGAVLDGRPERWRREGRGPRCEPSIGRWGDFLHLQVLGATGAKSRTVAPGFGAIFGATGAKSRTVAPGLGAKRGSIFTARAQSVRSPSSRHLPDGLADPLHTICSAGLPILSTACA